MWGCDDVNVCDAGKGQDDQSDGTGLRDQVVWSLGQCVHVFEQSLAALAVEFDAQGDGAMLAWDKVSNALQLYCVRYSGVHM